MIRLRSRTSTAHARAGGEGFGPLRRARGVAAALGLLLAAAPAAAQGGTADTTVTFENRAVATYRTSAGTDGSTVATVPVTLFRVAGAMLTPEHVVLTSPGARTVLAHRLENTGNGDDAFALSATGPSGWGLALYRDLDGDGALGPGDSPVAGPLPLERGGTAALLLVVDVPEDAATGVDVPLRVTARSGHIATLEAAVTDRLTVRLLLPSVTLAKAVDRTAAAVGDTLAYTLSWSNRGDGGTGAVTVLDTLPRGLRFVPGSLRLGAAPQTDAPGDDAGEVLRDASGRDIVTLRPGALTPGAAGSAAFRAVVSADAEDGALANTARLTFGVTGVVSNTTTTSKATPALSLAKTYLGADTVRAGDEVTFRIDYGNLSPTVSVRDVVLVDTLPAGLTLVSTSPQAEVEGNVLRWRLGNLAPGATGSVTLVTRAAPTSDGLTEVVNRATARGANASAVAATAVPLRVLAFRGDELEVEKTAAALEVGLGEAVPYAVTVRNKGTVPLRGVVLRDLLPAGLRYVDGSATGADSVAHDGRTLRFWLDAVAPGAERTVRYAATLVSAEGRVLRNLATAEAEGGEVRSDTAAALVRVRGGFAVQSRVLLGKVWLDADGDGEQDPGETGVRGVDVWSADGEIVRTDAEGRFSFPDVAPGVHTVRLDTVGLPAGWTLLRQRDGIVSLRVDGWTTPVVAFRLVRRAPAAASADSTASVAPAPSSAAAPSMGAAAPASPAPAVADTTSPRFETRVAASTPAAAVAAVPAPPAARVAPLRTEEERAEDARRALVSGPAPRVFAPVDGALVTSNRLYVGVRGEPGAEVRLYRGDSLLAETALRPDGVQDFVGLQIPEGPSRIRVAMRNSWGNERWDSIAVHRAGEPTKIEVEGDVPSLRADGRDTAEVRVRVRDAWGAPAGAGAAVTAEARGATVEGRDDDLSSVGMQVKTDGEGIAVIRLRAGSQVGPGQLRLRSGGVTEIVRLAVLPETRQLIATGAAMVGVGAAPDAFGTMTVRGAVGGETSVSVRIDSRRTDAEDDHFARGFDPLEEGRYPTLGDGSQRTALGGTTQTVSARVERGFDWLELGDVESPDFGGGEKLGIYRRTLTGVSGRVTTGDVVWTGFGSVTDQALVQRQLRGDGTSGPYRFGGGVRPGTERIAIESRAPENAARVVAREELMRYVDYQIDYRTGEVLLQRPIPATDATGNPVFVVARLETRTGGDSKLVGGLRAEVDAARLFRPGAVDSLGVAFFGVRGASGLEAAEDGAGRDLMGTEVRLRRGRLEIGGSLLRAQSADSSALAGTADAAFSLPGDRVRLTASVTRVGEGFASSVDPRLSEGLTEVEAGVQVKVAEGSRVALRHQRQDFEAYGVSRAVTTAAVTQDVGGRRLTAEAGVSSDAMNGGESSRSASGKATLAVSPTVDLWVEGSRMLSRGTPGTVGVAATRPDVLGVGASVRVWRNVRVEAAQRWVRIDPDSTTYGLTTVGLKGEDFLGGRAWGSVDRADDNRGLHAATLGWSPRLALHGGWEVTGLVERRFGIGAAPLVDLNRALPFAEPERDRWSTGLAVAYLPADSGARFSARAEVHDGDLRSGTRFEVAGDLPVSSSLALLTRHDWTQDRRLDLTDRRLSRRDLSVVGLAWRPTWTQGVNALAKLEWRRGISPLTGTLGDDGAADDRRFIGSGDLVWSPAARTEIATRYAVRWTQLEGAALGTSTVRSFAHFAGLRAERGLFDDEHRVLSSLRARVDGRLLVDAQGGEARWNAAPSLALGIGPQLEVEAGYRFGDLRDADFSAASEGGFFATLGVRFTERNLNDVAAFWRQRIVGTR